MSSPGAIDTAVAYCQKNQWPLLSQALTYCWSNEFLDVFRQYFRDHASDFRGMKVGMGSSEHSLEQHAVFQEYLQLYEDRLSEYIESQLGGSSKEFYEELADAKDVQARDPESCDAGTALFIECLVASADYDSFYKVMVREAQKLEAREAMEKMRWDAAPTVAEGKTAEGG
eukprot:CAMPEP_0119537996 /NCGR_PEP_ID=MMETSP1344-20130328/50532_1 /TAXON_ID=236787 /ORGANISM="Florenciella parvula, Strain CCMP2471" /LENGTH=170 /DNA_ID=CAMNT_0007580715 /DNA_START=32 /DNA_END=540 /DNA_ORIENTATION=-